MTDSTWLDEAIDEWAVDHSPYCATFRDIFQAGALAALGHVEKLDVPLAVAEEFARQKGAAWAIVLAARAEAALIREGE